jgi:hypothetical protein
MRLILFQAVVLALACSAAAQMQKSINLPPHAGINQFPAGIPQPNFPYAVPFYEPPPVPANHYRGAYVSWLQSVVGQQQHHALAWCVKRSKKSIVVAINQTAEMYRGYATT